MTSKATKLTFYGGVDEIGGNKILLKDGDTSIFLDFGMSFSLKNQYFSPPYLSPKNEESLLELGFLPDLKGVYNFRKDGKPTLDAVFLSHSHLDHSAYISFLKREIPVYCGETARTILKAYSRMYLRDLEFNIEGVKLKTFRTGDQIKIGSLTVEPTHVDHSVPGAYGFVVYSNAGAIAYTGDFRQHGAKGNMTEEFIEKAHAAAPTAVITEATNIAKATISTESEVKNKLASIVVDTPGLVLADFARADVDRLRSFHEAAYENERRLALTLKQVFLLQELRRDTNLELPNVNDDMIRIFTTPKKRHFSWEKTVLSQFEDKIVDSQCIAKDASKYVLALPFYSFEELVRIKPPSGSSYILSSSEPFNEESRVDRNKLSSWLRYYGVPQFNVHTSGHITPLQLRKALQHIRGRAVFGVHTEHAEMFLRYMSSVESKLIQILKTKEYTL